MAAIQKSKCQASERKLSKHWLCSCIAMSLQTWDVAQSDVPFSINSTRDAYCKPAMQCPANMTTKLQKIQKDTSSATPLRSSTAPFRELAFSSHFISSLRSSLLRMTPSGRKLALFSDNKVIVLSGSPLSRISRKPWWELGARMSSSCKGTIRP